MQKRSIYLKRAEGNEALSQIRNWNDFFLLPELCYSHRKTRYDQSNYPSSLHAHDYYEAVVYVSGDISYICEETRVQPHFGDIILVRPNHFHMSVINSHLTEYERYVFYFDASFFHRIQASALNQFLKQNDLPMFRMSLQEPHRTMMLNLLKMLDDAACQDTDPMERSLSVGYLIQFFYLLNQADHPGHELPVRMTIPSKAEEIRMYLEKNYRNIDSVSSVARHFNYSREYISRLFRNSFHTTIAGYIGKLRIADSQQLIAQEKPLSQVCYECGFENQTTFIRTFKEETGMTPSAYRAALRQKNPEEQE